MSTRNTIEIRREYEKEFGDRIQRKPLSFDEMLLREQMLVMLEATLQEQIKVGFDQPVGTVLTGRKENACSSQPSDNCPACGGAMNIVSVTPKAANWPELKTFQCVDCQRVLTIEFEGSKATPDISQ
jgi:hypothetical protein